MKLDETMSNSNYLIGCLDKAIGPLVLILPKMSGCVKEIVKWAEPCKCVILMVSRILWHMTINPSLKEWRFWYLILTCHFPA